MREDHTFHCYQCGTSLVNTRSFKRFWCDLFECPKRCEPGYLYIYDMRWIYPLQVLSHGIPEKLKAASDDSFERAFNRIRQIDYKTISIVAFEHELLGTYDPLRDYKIVYPDGSCR